MRFLFNFWKETELFIFSETFGVTKEEIELKGIVSTNFMEVFDLKWCLNIFCSCFVMVGSFTVGTF